MRPIVAALLLIPMLAGCLQASNDLAEADDVEPAEAAVYDLSSTPIQFTVPVDVVLIGFPAGTASDLQAALTEPESLEHFVLDYSNGLPPRADNPTRKLSGDGALDMPWHLEGEFRVHDFGSLANDFRATLAASTIAEQPGIHDGNQVEDWLAAALPEAGFDLDTNRTTLVLLHAGEGGHGYRFHGGDGWLEPVRIFGERHSVLVADVSARPDPYAGTSRSYAAPLEVNDIGEMEDLVRDITHFRLLHGPIYPITDKPCHGVTLILGVRAASLTNILPGFTSAQDAVDVPRMESHFRNLTGADNVFVDFVPLQLPVDDPVLDAVTRESVDLDAFRFWLDENWESYWVPHEGCEPYVSFALYGDAFDQEALFSGIAMYDVGDGHRISFSIVSDQTRIRSEWPGFVEPIDQIVSTAREGRSTDYWFNRLFSHETGHLFGQAHPHNAIEHGGQNYNGFSSVYDTMSYQVRGVVDDFGQVAQTNFLRNRAGWLLGQAIEADLQNADGFDQVTDHLDRYEWQAAGDVLVTLLAEAPADNSS